MKNKGKKLIICRITALLLALLILVPLTSCNAFKFDSQIPGGETTAPESTKTPEELKDIFAPLDIIDKAFRENTLFEIDDEKLIEALLKGYADGTGDKYAEYFTDEEYAAMVDESKGNLVGVGIRVVQNADENCVEIVAVMPDSPALESGVLPGDKVVYVGIGEDRRSVAEIGFTAAVDLLRGEEGTLAQFTVLRDGREIEFSIARRPVVNVSVDSHVYIPENGKKVGIVEIQEFNLTTPTAFESAMEGLIAAGCEYFIFDVRNNPGGDLASIIAVLAFFLNEGDVVIRTSDKSGVFNQRKIEVVRYGGNYAGCSIAREDIGKYRNLKSAVLTNENTASAAELFSATLKDYKISFTVGTTTFGKGTMQTMYHLSAYGYKGVLKLTTQYYYPPLSASYEGKGIVPDVEEPLAEELKNKNIYLVSDEEDNQLAAAIAELDARSNQN